LRTEIIKELGEWPLQACNLLKGQVIARIELAKDCRDIVIEHGDIHSTRLEIEGRQCLQKSPQ